MIGQVVTLGSVVALARAKAIVTNNCQKDVYIWSVPEKPDLANSLSIGPGKRYEEPWRKGTAANPGIAIKVSTEGDGIFTGKGEINFQYDVDPTDSNTIWIDLANVRGNDFDTATLNSCHGAFKGPNVSTKSCTSADDVELVLCGSKRTTPARDSTPSHVISNCIGLLTEREDQTQPRMCSGRVVGPKRIPMSPEAQAKGKQAERMNTVPLKTVMRAEAVIHAASEASEAQDDLHARNTAAAQVSASPGPLCALLHRAWPEAQCEEATAEHNARIFYQDNCGKTTRDMFPGTSCEAIKREIIQIYPNVIQPIPKVSTTHTTMCIKKYYPALTQLWGSKRAVKAVLNNQGVTENLFPDFSWTSDEDLCNSKNKTIKAVSSETRCVKRFCKDGGRLGGSCSDVEDVLESLSKDAGKTIDWTTDDDICTSKRDTTAKRDVNATAIADRGMSNVCIDKAYHLLLPHLYSKANIKTFLNTHWLFEDRHFTSDDNQCRNEITVPGWYKKQHPCVKSICSGGGGECSDVEKILNSISKDAGKKADWTSDDDYCPKAMRSTITGRGLAALALNTTSIRRETDVRNVCVITANEKLGKYWGADETELMVAALFPDIRWTDNVDDCTPQAIAASRAYHRKLIDKKQDKTKKCVVDCANKKTCKRVKKELNKLSKDVGKNWSWTDDEGLCGNSTLAVNRVLDSAYDTDLVCEQVLDSKAAQRLQRYWGNAYYDVLGVIYPNREFDTGGSPNCTAAYTKGVKKYFHDHTVKVGQRCVTPYCTPFGADCSDVEDELEKFGKNIGYDEDWTTDDDACPPNAGFQPFTPVNTVLIPTATNIPTTTIIPTTPILPTTTNIPATTPEICILPYCQRLGLGPNACVAEALMYQEQFFAAAGISIKFALDGPACQAPTKKSLQLPSSLRAERGPHKVCTKQLCSRSKAQGHDCNKVQSHFKRFMKNMMRLNIEFTDSNEVCGPSLARAILGSAEDASMKPQLCSKAFCAPHVPGVDCATFERDFQQALDATDSPSHATVTESESVCRDDAALGRPVVRDEQQRQKMCVRNMCASTHAGFEACSANFERYYRDIHGVEVVAVTEDDVCGGKEH